MNPLPETACPSAGQPNSRALPAVAGSRLSRRNWLSRSAGLVLGTGLGLGFGPSPFGLLSGLSLRSAGAAEFDPQALAQIKIRMQRFVDDRTVAGMVVLVGSKAGISLLQPLGQQSLTPAVPMQPKTLFRIASMTKPITALGAMRLAEEGRLKVTDPVEKYLPEFKGQMLVADRKDGQITLKKPSRPITIRDLLTHTSGMPGSYPEGLADMYHLRGMSLAEAVAVCSQRPLEFEPGSRWAYCNTGIDTLGRVIEVVSKTPFEQYLQQIVFEPLGMKDTAFYPSAEQWQRVATLYDQKDGQLQVTARPLIGPTDKARHPIPAGGLFSTAVDLARLYQAFLRGGELDGQRLVSPETLAEMTKVQTGDLTCGFVPGMSFGYGFAVVNQPQGVTGMLSRGTYGHGGAFGTQAWIDPQQDLFVVLLIQRNGLPNADGSEIRSELQTAAVAALKK